MAHLVGTGGSGLHERGFGKEIFGVLLPHFVGPQKKRLSQSHFVFMVRADGGTHHNQAVADEAHKIYPLLLGRRAILSEKSTTYFTGHAADEPSKEVWRRKRIGWLSKELPVRAGHAFFRMLKEQRKWMGLADAQKVMEQLMHRRELDCSYNVFKWTLEQPWYDFDYGLTTRMANLLGLGRKASKAHDLLNVVIASGKPPDASTFSYVILAYIKEGQDSSVGSAWTVYNQMILIGGYDPPLSVQNKLFSALVRVAEDVPECGEHADVVFHHIKGAGRPCSLDMHLSMMRVYARSGNRKKMDSLIRKMHIAHLSFGLEGFTSIMQLCCREGNVQDAERTWLQMVKAGLQPDGRAYLYVMKIYRIAGMPRRVHQKFMEMMDKGIEPGYKAYLVLIQSMADACQEAYALEFLDRLRHSGLSPLLPAYNAIMDMYLRMEAFDKLKLTFEQMQAQSCRPNRASYQILVESYLKTGCLEQAEQVFEYMLKTYNPNQETRNLMLAAYGKQGNLNRVKAIATGMDKRCRVSAENEQFLSAAKYTAVNSSDPITPAKDDLPLDSSQRETLVGLLLGGAHMGSDDEGLKYHVRLEFNPSTSLVAPCLMKDLNLQFSEWISQAPQNPAAHNSDLVFLSTISHTSLRFFASRYRPQGDAVIPRLIRLWLTPRALAYWYMYAGCRCDVTGDILLHASAYSSVEVLLVLHALKGDGLDSRRNNDDGSIQLTGNAAQLAWELMEPHILEDLKDLLRPVV